VPSNQHKRENTQRRKRIGTPRYVIFELTHGNGCWQPSLPPLIALCGLTCADCNDDPISYTRVTTHTNASAHASKPSARPDRQSHLAGQRHLTHDTSLLCDDNTRGGSRSALIQAVRNFRGLRVWRKEVCLALVKVIYAREMLAFAYIRLGMAQECYDSLRCGESCGIVGVEVRDLQLVREYVVAHMMRWWMIEGI